MKKYSQIFFFLITAFLLVTCSKKYEVELGNVSLYLPKNWVPEKPTNDLRTYQYDVSPDNDLKVLGFYFGKESGSDESNFDRWKNEFSDIKVINSKKFANGKIKYIEIEGNYKKKPFPMSKDFKIIENQKTLAAIVPSSLGKLYFKMNGETKEIDSCHDQFIEFLESYSD